MRNIVVVESAQPHQESCHLSNNPFELFHIQIEELSTLIVTIGVVALNISMMKRWQSDKNHNGSISLSTEIFGGSRAVFPEGYSVM